jgi:hypothetical protein
MRIRRDSKPFKILKNVLLAGGFLILSSIAPAAGARMISGIVGDYFRKKKFERGRLLRDLKNLQKRELLSYRELSDEKLELIITKDGKEKMLTYSLDEIKLNTKKKWDGKWRLILFDIPDHKKTARDAFRQKISVLGLYPIQKSVFITPYECENEIDFIASFFNIRKNILILYVSKFEGEEALRSYFGL